MSSLTALTYTSMTTAVNEMKPRVSFLRKKAFRAAKTHPTEGVEIGLFTRGRKIAPFVKKNGAAILATGHSSSLKLVEPTNIRIKRPFTPSELLFGRKPGSVVFAPGSTILSEARKHIARDLKVMGDDVWNAEEWLSAMGLRGSFSYEVADQESITVDFGKPAGNTIVLAGDRRWDSTDPTLPELYKDFHAVKRLIASEVGLGKIECVLGQLAADNFMRITANHPLWEPRAVMIGQVDFENEFSEDGVIYLGRFMGIPVYEYSATADQDGTEIPLVRTNYAEFFSSSPSARFVRHYGAIADLKVLRGAKMQTERFSKSWEQDDPSVMWALLTTRPLCVPERPGAMVSMEVCDAS